MNNLGLSLARAGQNLDEALKLVNDALAISGPMAEVLDSRASRLYRPPESPRKPWKTWPRPSRTTAAAEQYFHQAWAYSLAGKKTEASAAFAAAMKKGLDPKDLDPREVPIYDRLKERRAVSGRGGSRECEGCVNRKAENGGTASGVKHYGRRIAVLER